MKDTIELIWGHIQILPYDWVLEEDGTRIGQRFERINYDRNGQVTERKILEPVCWLRYE